MTETTNFNLKKPDLDDFYNVGDFNDNMDIIDEELAKCSLKLPFGTSNTSRADVVKVVTLEDFTLYDGALIAVRFTDTGASNPTAGNITLNVNGTGAKEIVFGKTNKTKVTYSTGSEFYNNVVQVFVYDGTNWVWVNRDTDTKNTAGTTNKVNAKMFLTGATSQATSPTTYSNVNCYIGTDNELYSNGKKVAHAEDIGTVDSTMSNTSTNAVQNKVIKSYVDTNVAQLADDNLNIKKLGWTVPSQLAVKNYIGTDGKFHQKVGRVNSKDLIWNAYGASTTIVWAEIQDIKIGTLAGVSDIYLRGYKADSLNNVLNSTVPKSISVHNTLHRVCLQKANASDVIDGYIYYELATEEILELDGQEAGYFARKNVTTNLLKPTLKSTTVNGVIVTVNSDLSITLNGTAGTSIGYTDIPLFGVASVIKKERYKFLGCPIGGSDASFYMYIFCGNGKHYFDKGYGAIFEIVEPSVEYVGYIRIFDGHTYNNVVFKPMITTDLDADYDSFVSYTGDTGLLNSDVAKLEKRQDNLIQTGRWTAIVKHANLTEQVCQYSKVGNIVNINCSLWGYGDMTDSEISVSLPFICRSYRAVGIVGYMTNKIAYPDLFVGAVENSTTAGFLYSTNGEPALITGKNFSTMQFSMTYITD